MTNLPTLAPVKSNILGEFMAATLNSIIANLRSAFRSQSYVRNQTEEAIEILRNPAATLDQLDWAERNLCGMQVQNAEKYFAGRRSQS
jgi:hypothetical protein